MAEKYETKVTHLIERELAVVSAAPGAVFLEVDLTTQSGELKPDQARQLGVALLQAADDSEHITYVDENDVDNLAVVDDRDAAKEA